MIVFLLLTKDVVTSGSPIYIYQLAKGGIAVPYEFPDGSQNETKYGFLKTKYGQLTPKGMRQMYLLGRKLDKDSRDYNVLNLTYFDPD